MGCFSYICTASGDEILDGEYVYLILYAADRIEIEGVMFGRYNCYGAVNNLKWNTDDDEAERIEAMLFDKYDGSVRQITGMFGERQGCSDNSPYHQYRLSQSENFVKIASFYADLRGSKISVHELERIISTHWHLVKTLDAWSVYDYGIKNACDKVRELIDGLVQRNLTDRDGEKSRLALKQFLTDTEKS